MGSVCVSDEYNHIFTSRSEDNISQDKRIGDGFAMQRLQVMTYLMSYFSGQAKQKSIYAPRQL